MQVKNTVNNYYITRYIESAVTDDLARKMVFIGGPRQSGKTTLAKHLCQLAGCDIQTRYLNWDAAADREKIIKETFPTGPGFLIGIRVCSAHRFLNDLI